MCSPIIAADVTLAWDPSSSPNIAGYRVYAGNASRNYGAPITIGRQTTYTVTGLTNATWFFAVTAYDPEGNESDFSNEVSKTTEEVEKKICDLNNDGKINILDLNLLARGILNGDFHVSRDYDNNKVVDVRDLRFLADVVVGRRVCP